MKVYVRLSFDGQSDRIDGVYATEAMARADDPGGYIRIEEHEVIGMAADPAPNAAPRYGVSRRSYHLHCRRHHRSECRCDGCASDGDGPCSETEPCRACLEYDAAREAKP